MAPSVYTEIQKRAAVLQAKDSRLSSMDAEAQVLRDPELYRRYVEEASTPPEPAAQAPRLDAEPSRVEAEVLRRADSLIAKSVGLSVTEAISEVFRDDPELYVQYVKSDTSAPTFADQLLGYELEGVYPLVNALMSTLRGIADVSAGDKGSKIQAALSEFSAAVLRVAGQAGIAVPAEKRASTPAQLIPAELQAEILKTAGHLCRDNYVQGMHYLTNTLREIRGAA
jgi:hypothetical protein